MKLKPEKSPFRPEFFSSDLKFSCVYNWADQLRLHNTVDLETFGILEKLGSTV